MATANELKTRGFEPNTRRKIPMWNRQFIADRNHLGEYKPNIIWVANEPTVNTSSKEVDGAHHYEFHKGWLRIDSARVEIDKERIKAGEEPISDEKWDEWLGINTNPLSVEYFFCELCNFKESKANTSSIEGHISIVHGGREAYEAKIAQKKSDAKEAEEFTKCPICGVWEPTRIDKNGRPVNKAIIATQIKNHMKKCEKEHAAS